MSARVVWRLGGTREGAYQPETFSAGTDAQNVSRADGFKKMVDAGGQRWPDGWVKGEGFVRPAGTDPLTAPPRFVDLGKEYVRQIVDLSPGQRKRDHHLGDPKTPKSRRTITISPAVATVLRRRIEDKQPDLGDHRHRAVWRDDPAKGRGFSDWVSTRTRADPRW